MIAEMERQEHSLTDAYGPLGEQRIDLLGQKSVAVRQRKRIEALSTSPSQWPSSEEFWGLIGRLTEAEISWVFPYSKFEERAPKIVLKVFLFIVAALFDVRNHPLCQLFWRRCSRI